MFELTDPKLAPEADGAVRSDRYRDIYFQRRGAQDEKRLVFLTGCALPERWRGQRRHTVAETGFGTGLTFLETWRLWRQHRLPEQRLHYLAVEAHPFTESQLAGIHRRWPALKPFSAELLRCYPALTPGYHRLQLADDVTLTLMFGDVLDELVQLEAVVDSWFLDGFSPSCNPQMWRAEVLAEVARLTATEGRLATFTTATRVREELARLGFALSRAPGFGSKRERLMGVYGGRPASGCPGWFQPPAPPSTDRVTIIGGGVAGRCLASALRQRQRRVEVLDGGSGASSNPSVSVMPRLEAGDGPAGRFFWHAYRYALSYWSQRAEFDPCGALLLADGSKAWSRFHRIAELWRAEPKHLAVLPAPDVGAASGVGDLAAPGALWFPEAGVVRNYGRDAFDEQNVSALVPGDSAWRLEHSGKSVSRETVVLATGADALGPTTGLPLERWRGRSIRINQTKSSASLRCAVFGPKYLHPPAGGHHWAGASFEREGTAAVRPALASAITEAFPTLNFSAEVVDEWSGWRLATPDRLPVAGPVLDMTQAAAKLRWVRGGRPGEPAPWLAGLYLIGGLGARGFTTGPLLGEWLASVLVGDPWPLPRDLALGVCTSRFVLRDLRRGQVGTPAT